MSHHSCTGTSLAQDLSLRLLDRPPTRIATLTPTLVAPPILRTQNRLPMTRVQGEATAEAHGESVATVVKAAVVAGAAVHGANADEYPTFLIVAAEPFVPHVHVCMLCDQATACLRGM